MKEQKSVKRGKKNETRQQKNKREREKRGRLGGGLNTGEGVNVGG